MDLLDQGMRNLVSREGDLRHGAQTGGDHIAEGVVFLVEGED